MMIAYKVISHEAYREKGSLPEKRVRMMIVKMIQNLANRMEKLQETFNKDPERKSY